MRRAVLALALISAACAKPDGTPRTYANSDEQLAVANAARMSCSCLFVMDMSVEYCRAWVKASPNVAHFSVDKVQKTVEATALISWAATARYVDDQRGCVLE